MKTQNPEIILPSKDEKELAHKTHQQIVAMISETHDKEKQLNENYVTLGSLIYRMQAKNLWMILGYNKWSDYFQFLQDKYDSGRSQLYAYMNIAKKLLPIIPEKSLVKMGVDKAGLLRKALDTTGKAPSDNILKIALDPNITSKQFKADLFKEFKIIDSSEPGVWFDIGGFYVSPDEKQLIKDTIEKAKSIDPVISKSLPDHIQTKEAILRMCQECISSWSLNEP